MGVALGKGRASRAKAAAVRAAKLAAHSSSTVCDWSAKVDASGIGMHALLASLICTALLVGLAVHASHKAHNLEDLHNKRALVLMSHTNPLDVCIGGHERGKWFVYDDWPLANCYATHTGSHDRPQKWSWSYHALSKPSAESWCRSMAFPVLDDGVHKIPVPVDALNAERMPREGRLRVDVLVTIVQVLHRCGGIPVFYTIKDIRDFAGQHSNASQVHEIRDIKNTSKEGMDMEEFAGALLGVVGKVPKKHPPTLSDVTSRVYCPANATAGRWNASSVEACDSFFYWRIHSNVTGEALWMQVTQTDSTAKCLVRHWKVLSKSELFSWVRFNTSWALAPYWNQPIQLSSNYGIWLSWSAKQASIFAEPNAIMMSAYDPDVYECMNHVDVAQHDTFRDHVGTADEAIHSSFLQLPLNLSYADVYAFYTGSLAAVFAGVAAVLASLSVVAAVLVVRCFTLKHSTGVSVPGHGVDACLPVVAQSSHRQLLSGETGPMCWAKSAE